jgi:hypothetical protein
VTIIRAPREDRFTVLNRSIIADDRLSYRALGLLVYLLDKPDNWRVEATDLGRGDSREGRDAIRTALTELAERGYLVRRRLRNDKGQWLTETYLYETPGHTDDGFPGVGAPADGSPGALPKTVCEDGNEDCSSSPPTPRKRGEVDEAFEAWWALYPKKKAGKGQAREKWRKMTAAERLAAMLVIQTHVAWWIEHATDERFIPAGNVWLNQRRWEDEEPRSATVLSAVPNDPIERVRQKRAAARAVGDQT